MKAMLYLPRQEDPVSILDEVAVVNFQDNHKANPERITYKTKKFNAGKSFIEVHRHEPFIIKLEDGRQGSVLLQHASLDSEGNYVGVLRVVGELQH